MSGVPCGTWRRTGYGIAIALALGASAIGNAQRSGAAGGEPECVRPPASQYAAGAVVAIKSASRPPCRVVLRETGVVLRADADGRVADIQGRVEAGHDGAFLSATGFGQVALWNADGSLAHLIGAPGAGPGELARGGLSIFAAPSGVIAVRDNSYRWSLFSRDGLFVRQLSAVGMGAFNGRSAFTSDGMFLTADLVRMPQPSQFFHLYDFAAPRVPATGEPPGRSSGNLAGPRVVRSFGPIPDSERALPSAMLFRLVSYVRGNQFWTGPPATAGRGYELELWNTDGARLRTLRREAAWYPAGSDRAIPRQEGTPPTRTPSQLTYLHHDGNGVLFVIAWVMSDRWRALPAGTRPADFVAMERAAQDVYYDVIDADAGVVLASGGPFKTDDPRSRLPALLQGRRVGFVRDTAPGGLPVAREVEYRLVRQ